MSAARARAAPASELRGSLVVPLPLAVAAGVVATVGIAKKLAAFLSLTTGARALPDGEQALASADQRRQQHRQRRVMVVAVGSQNQCKVRAVASVLREFPEYATAEARGFAAPTGVSAQPMALGEIVTGAKHRAEAAAAMNAATAPPPALAFSVGIESGLMQVEGEGYYDVCACSVWDGATHHVGFSCAFKIPRVVIDNLLQNGCELSEAINNVGLANDANVGRKNGLIGIMTGDRVTRQQYTEQAVHMALLSVRNRAWFQNDTASGGAGGAASAAKNASGRREA